MSSNDFDGPKLKEALFRHHTIYYTNICDDNVDCVDGYTTDATLPKLS